MKIKQVVKLGAVGLMFSLLAVGVASAHVTLDPKEGVIGYQRYTVTVPNEKDIPTVELRLVVPENVDIMGVAPIAGWAHSEKREAVEHNETSEDHDHAQQGRITEITWTGGQIKSGEYLSFGVSTRYEGEAADITWKAYQKYADGSVVAWDGADEKLPAPVVSITEASKVETLTQGLAEVKKSSENQAPLWFSFIAVLFSVAAFMVALRKR
jgi:uncharacterized protein YcnI